MGQASESHYWLVCVVGIGSCETRTFSLRLHLDDALSPCSHQPTTEPAPEISNRIMRLSAASRQVWGLYLRYRNVEIQPIGQNRTSEQYNENRKGSILVVSHLNLHAPKLHPPADIPTGWGRLETHMLPVCGLDVLAGQLLANECNP